MLEKVIERMRKQDIELEITEQAKAIIIQNGTDYKYGARPLRRTIQNLIEDTVAEKILEGEGRKKIVLDEEGGKIIVQ